VFNGPERPADGRQTARNAQGRLRIARIEVEIHLGCAAGELKMLERALAQFEDFCLVTQSVRVGIAVDVRVFDRDGLQLEAGPPRSSATPSPIETLAL